MAATGEPGVSAVTAKPAGAFATASRWLIQQTSAARSPNMPRRERTVRAVLPNSPAPVRATSPPIARAIACMP